MRLCLTLLALISVIVVNVQESQSCQAVQNVIDRIRGKKTTTEKPDNDDKLPADADQPGRSDGSDAGGSPEENPSEEGPSGDGRRTPNNPNGKTTTPPTKADDTTTPAAPDTTTGPPATTTPSLTPLQKFEAKCKAIENEVKTFPIKLFADTPTPKNTPEHLLSCTAVYLIGQVPKIAKLVTDKAAKEATMKYFEAIEKRYRPSKSDPPPAVPEIHKFHGKRRAIWALHDLHAFVINPKLKNVLDAFETHEIAAWYVAVAGRHVVHPGFSNAFIKAAPSAKAETQALLKEDRLKWSTEQFDGKVLNTLDTAIESGAAKFLLESSKKLKEEFLHALIGSEKTKLEQFDKIIKEGLPLTALTFEDSTPKYESTAVTALQGVVGAGKKADGSAALALDPDNKRDVSAALFLLMDIGMIPMKDEQPFIMLAKRRNEEEINQEVADPAIDNKDPRFKKATSIKATQDLLMTTVIDGLYDQWIAFIGGTNNDFLDKDTLVTASGDKGKLDDTKYQAST